MAQFGHRTMADQDTWSRYTPRVLSIVRIVIALLFFEHGLSKLFGFPQVATAPALFSLSWFAGAIELVGGALLAVGLFSRASAFVMRGQGLRAFQTVGEFRIEATGDDSRSFRYGYVLFRLKSEKSAQEDKI